MYQWKQDIGAAERCCHEALRVDPECEAAVATLAQLSLQQAKIPEAVKMFERQAELARSEPELINALTYQYVSRDLPCFLHVHTDEFCRRPVRRLRSCKTTPTWRPNSARLRRAWVLHRPVIAHSLSYVIHTPTYHPLQKYNLLCACRDVTTTASASRSAWPTGHTSSYNPTIPRVLSECLAYIHITSMFSSRSLFLV